MLLNMVDLGYLQHSASMQRPTFTARDYHEYTVLPSIHSALLSTKS